MPKLEIKELNIPKTSKNANFQVYKMRDSPIKITRSIREKRMILHQEEISIIPGEIKFKLKYHHGPPLADPNLNVQGTQYDHLQSPPTRYENHHTISNQSDDSLQETERMDPSLVKLKPLMKRQ